ncbi:gastrin-releasing peptide [Austrofundulus limnaeus]|uniref:Gastrin-releasing peptide n=1 Tax=Austrofundulus limnaeus TaxID=52670 RepID=A0A2I4BAL9_AUSLI|nr:PREDICTED: gastrin-releasing peptide [Austrofundulus limnaeus]
MMGGVCLCCSWTCRPLWPLFIFLAAAPCFLHCSETPAAVVGKMYPRGNHWAVGHLMGKKSTENLQKPNADSDYLTDPQSVRTFELDQPEGPAEALQPRDQNQKTLQRLLHSSWKRAGDRAEHLQEMSDLLHLALKLQDIQSS